MVERALSAMCELNGRTDAGGDDSLSIPPGWASSSELKDSSSMDQAGVKGIKRSRLPAAAVKEMR